MKNSISLALLMPPLLIAGYAEAKPVRNPVYELDFHNTCKAGKLPKDISEQNMEGENVWKVKRVTIINNLHKRYPMKNPVLGVELTDDDIKNIALVTGSSNMKEQINAIIDRRRKHMLALKLAPCYEKEIKTADNEKDNEQCHYTKLLTTPSERFKSKDETLRFRHALLSLFKAAQTGAANNFVVVRQGVKKDKIDKPGENITIQKDGTWKYEYIPMRKVNGKFELSPDPEVGDIFEYNPTYSAYIDDQMIGDFLTAETPPYSIYCKGSAAVNSSDEVFQDKGAQKLAQADSVPLDNKKLQSLYGKSLVENSIENSIPSDGKIDIVGKLLKERTIKEHSWSDERPSKKLTWKPRFVEAPGDFAKSKPENAVLGFKTDENVDAIAIKAATGILFQNTKKYKNGKSTTFSATPFFSINQDTVEVKLADVSVALPAGSSENIAYADYSVGARMEWDHQRAIKYYAEETNNFRRRYNRSGLTELGWRFGVTGEWFTDNYIEQMGLRLGGDLSFPSFLNIPGYRRDYTLIWDKDEPKKDAPEIRQQPLGQKHWVTGWSFNWKIDPALDYIDYNRAPLDFSTADPFDREVVKSYFAAGINSSFKLKKQGIYGLASDSAWLELGLDYSHRRTGIIGTNIGTFDLTEFSFKVIYPEIDNLSFGVSYEIGETLKSQKDKDSFKAEIGIKY